MRRQEGADAYLLLFTVAGQPLKSHNLLRHRSLRKRAATRATLLRICPLSSLDVKFAFAVLLRLMFIRPCLCYPRQVLLDRWSPCLRFLEHRKIPFLSRNYVDASSCADSPSFLNPLDSGGKSTWIAAQNTRFWLSSMQSTTQWLNHTALR